MSYRDNQAKAPTVEAARRTTHEAKKIKLYGGGILSEIGMAGTQEKVNQIVGQATKFQARGRVAEIDMPGPSLAERVARIDTPEKLADVVQLIKDSTASRSTRRRLLVDLAFAAVRCAATESDVAVAVGEYLAVDMRADRRRALRAYAEKRIGEIRVAGMRA